MYRRSIFWFRRDLRIDDNTGLYYALKESKEVFPLFIFDENIIKNLPSRSKRLGLFIEAVRKLYRDIKEKGSNLHVLKGDPLELIPKLVNEMKVEAVYVNRAHSLNGTDRDRKLARILGLSRIAFKEFEDTLLVEPEKIPQRRVFSPFYRIWSREEKRGGLLNIERIVSPKAQTTNLENILSNLNFSISKNWSIDFADSRLKEFDFCNYKTARNLPGIDGTSRLSPYIRFGIISVRQVYNEVSSLSFNTESYITELAWREFWYHVMHYFPETRELEFQEKRRGIEWINNDEWYEAWKEGKTGYPIVDAGMRQLKEEGWIHNRVRMIVASFLTKDLLIDWRLGDRHFYDCLIDYDETVDIGNWQWAASVGADPRPLRIFNPILQSKRYDPDCLYIKRYVPELRDVDPVMIHDPIANDLPYYKPVVDHYEMSVKAKNAYIKSS